MDLGLGRHVVTILGLRNVFNRLSVRTLKLSKWVSPLNNLTLISKNTENGLVPPKNLVLVCPQMRETEMKFHICKISPFVEALIQLSES